MDPLCFLLFYIAAQSLLSLASLLYTAFSIRRDDDRHDVGI